MGTDEAEKSINCVIGQIPHDPTPPVPDVNSIGLSDARAILTLPLIAPSPPNPPGGNIEFLAEKYGVGENISVELDSMSIIKDLVRSVTGCALTTYAHLANEIEHDIL